MDHRALYNAIGVYWVSGYRFNKFLGLYSTHIHYIVRTCRPSEVYLLVVIVMEAEMDDYLED